MRICIDVDDQLDDPPTPNTVASMLREIVADLARITHTMSALSDKLDALETTASTAVTVSQNAVALIEGLAAQVADGGATPGDLTRLDNVNNAVNTAVTNLQTVVTANQPH